jgi:hypothetical protein
LNPLLDSVHDKVIAAMKGIKNGKGLNDSVAYPPVGTRIRIFDALNEAREYLKEPFHADHIELVDSVFGRTWLLKPSDRIDECATALINILANRIELRGPSEAALDSLFGVSGHYVRARDGTAFKYWARGTSEFPRTWEARIFLESDKPRDVLKDAPREILSGPLVDIQMSDDLLLRHTRDAIEQSIEACETV